MVRKGHARDNDEGVQDERYENGVCYKFCAPSWDGEYLCLELLCHGRQDTTCVHQLYTIERPSPQREKAVVLSILPYKYGSRVYVSLSLIVIRA